MKTIELHEHGSSIGPRVLGLELSKTILEDIKADSELVIAINFEGIKTLSSGFALELFGNLKAALENKFSSKIKIKFTGDQSIDNELKAIIFRALQTSLPQRQA